jgi:hypothetical protein
MTRIYFVTLFGILMIFYPVQVSTIDLSKLYGHYGPPVQKRSGKNISF